MKRYLSVWFQEWPLTRLRRARRRLSGKPSSRTSAEAPETHKPFALLEDGAHGLKVAAANASARRLGVAAGLRFTDAKARCPDLQHEDIDREADALALSRIGAWMIRFSPLVAIDGHDGLMIETTGCAHLHGGEREMLQAISAALEAEAIPHWIGLAGTQGAAFALARSSPNTILAEGGEADGLATLPVSSLRLSVEAETLLKRFGLHQIGQLYGIDRKALGRRFQSKAAADAVLLRLDQALGLRHEPINPITPPPAISSRQPCPEPLLAKEGILAGLDALAAEVCGQLAARGEGARGFAFHAFRADGGVSSVSITLARPSRSAKHVLKLFDEKIDQIDPGFGIDLLVLEARRTGLMDTSPAALSGDLAVSDSDPVLIASLVDRITAKLGEGVVRFVEQSESHFPDRAELHARFAGELPGAHRTAPHEGPRPIRLIEPPEEVEVLAEVPDGPPVKFVWRRLARHISRADGPERIAPEWWAYTAPPPPADSPDGVDRKWLAPKLDKRADAALIAKLRADLEAPRSGEVVSSLPRARDYYRVEDEEGRRYWVFRQGLYGDGRGEAPRWFIHGLFA